MMPASKKSEESHVQAGVACTAPHANPCGQKTHAASHS